MTDDKKFDDVDVGTENDNETFLSLQINWKWKSFIGVY